MKLDRAPTYNLGAVLHETGLAPDTLRAWERRYGIPNPQRTPGGRRLYSERDIYIIKWLMNRRSEGLTISRAVDHWRELTSQGQDPLGESGGDPGVLSTTQPAVAGQLKTLRDAWLGACLQFDEAASKQILNQAFGQHSVETVVAGLIQEALHEVGQMWMRGEASVQQEHFLTAMATKRLDALIAAAPAPIREEVILLACVESELHAWPMLHISLLLRRRGLKVVYLGAGVPTAQLDETARAVHTAVLVLSAQGLVSAARLQDAAAHLAPNGIPIVFGGWIFAAVPDLRQQIPGHYGGDISSTVGLIEQLAERPTKINSARRPVGNVQARAYSESRREIETAVLSSLSGVGIPPGSLEAPIARFGEALEAALQLGNVSYLGADPSWRRAMLEAEGFPPQGPAAFLRAQAKALLSKLGRSAAPIADWLEGYASGMRGEPPEG